MKINSELLNEIEKHVSALIINESSDKLIYHRVSHTKLVVQNAKTIGVSENLNESDLNILLASAWFHDTGYTIKYNGHEEESVAIAKRFLNSKGIDKDTIEHISECIMATKSPQNPTDNIAEILCDADLMHLGKENYSILAEELRQELIKTSNLELKKLKFEKDSLKLFKNHTFFTNYCKTNFTEIKNNNLKVLEESIKKRQAKIKAALKKANSYSRGVDSMFKLTARNQINLSSIADNKSNILISLNGIIISIGLVALASKFKEEPSLILPTVIFIFFSLTTIVLAILSTRPNISSGKFSKEDIKQKKVNMLFFGNFYNMELEDYEWAVKEMINDDQYLYSAMTKDQYSLGKVLAQKYKLLRWAYNIFMIGIISSVIAFLLVFIKI